MAVAHRNVITSTTPMTHQLWHYQPDGMAKEEGVSTTSSLVLMGRALELRLWMSVTQLWDVMESMIINPRVITI